MSKVYIVTQGRDSDYHVVAVFSTEQKAREYIEVFQTKWYRDLNIEEHNLDEVK